MNSNPYSKTSIFDEERKKDDLSIRLPIDVYGKQLFEERAKNNAYEVELRERILPEIPGFKAETLVNRYYQERFLDGLVKLRMRAQYAEMDSPINMVSEVAWGVASIIKGIPSLIFSFSTQGISEGISRVLDAGSDAKKFRNNLMKEFHKKSAEFILLQNSIMLNERMNWVSYRVSEQDRAYMSQSRLEWFTLGTALSGISQSVEMAYAEMEKEYRFNKAEYEGTQVRRSGLALPGLFRDAAGSVLSYFKS